MTSPMKEPIVSDSTFKFMLSSEMTSRIRLKIGSLEPSPRMLAFFSSECDPAQLRLATSSLSQVDYQSGPFALSQNPFLYISCALVYGKEENPIEMTTNTTFCNQDLIWNTWLDFPFKYSRLGIDSRLIFTVWQVVGARKKVPIARASIPFFDQYRMLNRGRHKLFLMEDAESFSIETYERLTNQLVRTDLDRLETLVDRYERDAIPKIDWLDKSVFEQLTKTRKTTIRTYSALIIEMPIFEFPIVFHEKEYRLSFKSPPTSDITVFDPQNELFDPNVWLPDPHRRPSPLERDQIGKILRYPLTKPLDTRDKDLLWRVRFHLLSNKKALSPFLRAIDWNNPKQAEQATELLYKWEAIDVTDALELLTISFNPVARKYAVKRLDSASDREILDYLLQLVQAARYELSLVQLLISRARSNMEISHYLCWSLRVEIENPIHSAFYQKMFQEFEKVMPAQFLDDSFSPQVELIGSLNAIYGILREMKTSQATLMTKKFQDLIAPNGQYGKLGQFTKKMPFPLDPSYKAEGLTQKVKVYTSSLAPLGMFFRLENRQETRNFNVIFKSGDDIRQDQVIMQIIFLMDRILKNESLDLKLSPYRILATGLKTGMVECVENSLSILKILDSYKNDIRNYLREFNPDPNNKQCYGIKEEVFDAFVKSSAGYCVITYLLAIGDRHLDNLLVTQDGRLFHVDFGFVAADPKPLAPPMKLSKDMITALGGQKSKHFLEFKKASVECFTVLRRHANLFLTLITLMSSSGIEHLKLEQTVFKIQERFHLDRTEEEAALELEHIIHDSADAFFANMTIDTAHWIMQYWANRK